MSGYDVALADQGCTSCGHAADQECPCGCCGPLCPGCTRPLDDEGLTLFCRWCQREVSFGAAIRPEAIDA